MFRPTNRVRRRAAQAQDELTHLQWKDRTSNTVVEVRPASWRTERELQQCHACMHACMMPEYRWCDLLIAGHDPHAGHCDVQQGTDTAAAAGEVVGLARSDGLLPSADGLLTAC